EGREFGDSRPTRWSPGGARSTCSVKRTEATGRLRTRCSSGCASRCSEFIATSWDWGGNLLLSSEPPRFVSGRLRQDQDLELLPQHSNFVTDDGKSSSCRS